MKQCTACSAWYDETSIRHSSPDCCVCCGFAQCESPLFEIKTPPVEFLQNIRIPAGGFASIPYSGLVSLNLPCRYMPVNVPLPEYEAYVTIVIVDMSGNVSIKVEQLKNEI